MFRLCRRNGFDKNRFTRDAPVRTRVFDAIVVFLCESDFVEEKMVNWVGSAKTLHTVRESERKGWGPHGVGFLIIKLQLGVN